MVRLQRSRQCLHRPDRQWLCLGLQYRRVQSLCGNTSYGPVSFKATAAIWTNSKETHYVYDGMLVVQERDGSNTPQVSYTRGKDLSGKRQGAGGIGGLLAYTSSGVSHFYHSDGLGNVTALANVNNQVSAAYNYDPYGNLLGSSGPMANLNHYRFSSKEIHPGSGTYAYGYRFYDPNLQRWLNRDPIGENGGINLFGFVENSPAGFVDPFGFTDNAYHYDDPDDPDSGNANFDAERQRQQEFMEMLHNMGEFLEDAVNATPVGDASAALGSDLMGNQVGGMAQCMAIAGFIPGGKIVGLAGKTGAKICKKAAAVLKGASHGHHAIPKFLGGHAKQILSKLEPAVHIEFHQVLRQKLADAGFPLNVGGKDGTKIDWARYMNANPGSQQKALDAVLNSSREIDAKYGTSITQAVWTNLINGHFTSYP